MTDGIGYNANHVNGGIVLKFHIIIFIELSYLINFNLLYNFLMICIELCVFIFRYIMCVLIDNGKGI